MGRTTTTATTTARATRRTTTLSPTSTMSSRDALVQHVMSMDPPELRDALMDPMMMAIGMENKIESDTVKLLKI